MELRKAELREAGPRNAPRDETTRFLGELRQLRTDAGLGHTELAARAHYPCDVIRGVEAGPSLPSLPVLSAFVRGCGGTPSAWEERWRSLTRSPALPLLPVRTVGDSDAATAGARVGAATPAAEGHNPDFILAALGRVAGSIAAEPSDAAALDTPVVREEVPDPVISGGLPSPGADSWAAPTAAAPAPSPAQAPAPATAAGVPAGTSSGPTARSSRLLPNWETIATIVAVLILVVILLAIFA